MALNRRNLKRIILPSAFIAVAVGFYGWTEIYRRQDFSVEFAERKGRLVEAEEVPVSEARDGRIYRVRLLNNRGLAVHAGLRLPESGDGPFPAFLILGGLRTGSRVIEMLADVGDVVLLALDYPYEGKKSHLSVLEFITALPRARRALMETVPASMMAVDYLLTKDEVDPARLVFIGGSLGALFGPALGAADGRIAAIAMLFGAGDLGSLIAANLEVTPWIARPAGWAGSLLTSPLEPLKYIHRISPRPVFMMSAANDPRMPAHCSRVLHEHAGEPKTIRWIPTDHISIHSKEFHRLVRSELEGWLEEQGIVATR
jgi:hypothetical protein